MGCLQSALLTISSNLGIGLVPQLSECLPTIHETLG